MEELQERWSKNTHVNEKISSDHPIESPSFPNLSEGDEVSKHYEDVVEDPILTSSNDDSSQNVQEGVASQVILNAPSQLPSKLNRGVPKKQYELDLKIKVKYPISNYISSHRFLNSYALAVNQLSKVSIPSSVQNALTDPKWTKAMYEEIEVLQRNSTWELVPLPREKKSRGL